MSPTETKIPMQFSDSEFKTRLWDTITAIEAVSGVEIVVMIKPASADYTDTALLGGAICSFLAFTIFMFAPMVFGDYLIYTGTIAGFTVGVLAVSYSTPLKRLLSGAARRRRNVEIMARALFQKGELHHTRDEIGTLIYCSLLERQVIVLADRGAAAAIPPQQWQRLQVELDSLFTSAEPASRFIEVLAASRELFTRYLPIAEDDINEIPDDLEVTL